MPYDISWHKEKRIVYEHLYGNLTVEEATAAAADTDRLIKQGEAPVHLIVSLKDLEKPPIHIRDSGKFTNYLNDPMVGWVVLIISNPLIDFFVSISAQLVKFRLGKARSVEEAVEFISKQDPSIVP